MLLMHREIIVCLFPLELRFKYLLKVFLVLAGAGACGPTETLPHILVD